MRLNRYLAACGLGSRRKCEELVLAGRVRVNGAPAALGMRVGPGDAVLLDGSRVTPETAGGVWLLHKPAGYVCTASDERGRPTVLDLAREKGLRGRLFPVGRLDLDTTGLLLLTNDGELAFRLTHPSHGVEKEYEARIAGPLPADSVARLRAGIELDDGPTSPCRVDQESCAPGALVRLVLHEGRKRQVRRMLAAVGAAVAGLRRVRVGPIQLGDLQPGALRAATDEELAALHAATAPGAKSTAVGDAAPG
jgi:23S rRNA pseudouridine2605 synthase